MRRFGRGWGRAAPRGPGLARGGRLLALCGALGPSVAPGRVVVAERWFGRCGRACVRRRTLCSGGSWAGRARRGRSRKLGFAWPLVHHRGVVMVGPARPRRCGGKCVSSARWRQPATGGRRTTSCGCVGGSARLTCGSNARAPCLGLPVLPVMGRPYNLKAGWRRPRREWSSGDRSDHHGRQAGSCSGARVLG
jgi:hypothetical protein